MSDDLTLRLHNLWAMLEEEGYYTKANTVELAINRIEGLEAKLAEYNLLWQAYELDKVVSELKGNTQNG